MGSSNGAGIDQFIKIEPGSIVHTDGWEGYTGLEKKGYKHKITVVSRRKESASELLPHVHRVVSLLKRWLMGTHQGAVSHEHLDYYLDEFTFRFNRRTSGHRGKLFFRLLQHHLSISVIFTLFECHSSEVVGSWVGCVNLCTFLEDLDGLIQVTAVLIGFAQLNVSFD